MDSLDFNPSAEQSQNPTEQSLDVAVATADDLPVDGIQPDGEDATEDESKKLLEKAIEKGAQDGMSAEQFLRVYSSSFKVLVTMAIGLTLMVRLFLTVKNPPGA